MEKPEVYLDNAATTRVCAEAADIAYKVMTECYGNPSSTHTKGREAKAVSDRIGMLVGHGSSFFIVR